MKGGSVMELEEALGVAAHLRENAPPVGDGSISDRQKETVIALADGVEKQRLLIQDLTFQRGKLAHWAGVDISELEERYGVPGER